ncbi:MAG: tetratricopeptide repeat protein [Sphingobacteriales bacterium]|nr:MAG: tetratricopeptide repeat protein [Sphingobacteriales bacterium]
MRKLLVFAYLLLQGSLLFAQKEKRDIHKGNQLYQQQKYAEAEAWYKKSVEKSKESVVGNFNLGDAFYKQKKLEDAAQKFNEIAGTATNKAVKAQAYHNLGNALLESNKLEESIEAYKKSLINNPKDDETRYNLAYAQEKLKQQQQQNKDNKDNKDKDNKDKNNKDKNDKDQKDQDKNKDNKDNQDKKDQNKDQDKDQDKKDQQPQPDKLSKEDAERMLEALNNEEKNTQDKLKNKKAKGTRGKIVKDW